MGALPVRMGKFRTVEHLRSFHEGAPHSYGKVRGKCPRRRPHRGFSPHVGKLGRTKRGQFSVRDALRPCGGVCYIEPNKLVLSAHVGRFLNGFPSTPDALAVPFVWGCFAVGAVEPPSRGLSRPRRGRMGETGIVSPPGGIRRVRHRRCRGVRETPFSERSACRIYCRRRRGGMRWARHLPY